MSLKIETDVVLMEASLKPRHSFTRPFRKDGDVIRITNDTDTEVYINCTHYLVTALKSTEVGLNAGLDGVGVEVGVAKQLVHSQDIVSRFKLKPKESQDVLPDSKFVRISAYALRGSNMTLLYQDFLVKKGYNHAVEQKDVDNALSVEEIEKLRLSAT
jgi:hypothetical protein